MQAVGVGTGTLATGLVQIQRQKPERKSFFQQLSEGPFVDKFFLTAVLSGFIGLAYLGVHLWLMRSGVIGARQSYPIFKTAHAWIQLFLFFGLFCLGFAVQAAPKLLGVKGRMPQQCYLPLVLLPLGVVLKCFSAIPWLGSILLSAGFAVVLAAFVQLSKKAASSERHSIRNFIVLGMLGFIAGAWMPVERSDFALLVFWIGLMPIILGAAQQFVSGFLGGRILSPELSNVILTAHLITSGLMVAGCISSEHKHIAFQVAAACALLVLILYGLGVGLWSSLSSVANSPLHLAFALAWLWACLAPLAYQFVPLTLDMFLHQWTIGLGVTLVMAVSCQVLGFVSGKQLFSNAVLFSGLILWQIVPLFRTFSWLDSYAFSLTANVIASVVYGVWTVQVVRAAVRMLRLQFALKQGQKMVEC
jgi:hypothetical protein